MKFKVKIIEELVRTVIVEADDKEVKPHQYLYCTGECQNSV